MNILDLRAASEHAQNFDAVKLRKNFKISGIYAIKNTITGKVYIGSAINIGDRLHKHRGRLRSNIHPNKHLQLSWNKYWEQSFEFIILEYVEHLSLLLHSEECWIERYKSYEKEFGYNARRKPNSNLGLKFSEETKKKQSISQTGISRNKGFRHTNETKLKVSLANKGKPKPHFRDIKKWPHPEGADCKCIECKSKRNEYEKQRKLEDRRAEGALPIRKLDKWPHPLGCKCRCDECKTKNNAFKLIIWHKRKIKRFTP